MNPIHCRVRGRSLVIAAALLSLRLAGAQAGDPAPPAPSSPAREEAPEVKFPFVIRVTTWAASEGFHKGDQVKIAEVRGDRKRIEPGGTYFVRGTYALASAPTGKLMLSLTTSARPGGRVVARPQFYNIEQGTGTFTLVEKMQDSGQFHVSLYLPAKSSRGVSSQGGIYFDNR